MDICLLQVPPTPATRTIRKRRAGARPQPVPLAGDKRLHLVAAVGGQAVPPQRGLLPTQNQAQLASTPIRVSVLSLPGCRWNASSAPPPAGSSHRGGYRGALAIERVHQQWRLATGRPGRAHAWGRRISAADS